SFCCDGTTARPLPTSRSPGSATTAIRSPVASAARTPSPSLDRLGPKDEVELDRMAPVLVVASGGHHGGRRPDPRSSSPQRGHLGRIVGETQVGRVRLPLRRGASDHVECGFRPQALLASGGSKPPTYTFPECRLRWCPATLPLFCPQRPNR